MKAIAFKLVLLASSTLVSTVSADTTKIELPENYRSTFVRYTSVDKPNAENPEKTKMRYFYVNPQALSAAQTGQPAPAGTVLIMEDHAVERDDTGKARVDAAGRLIPTDEITNVFVQEKQSGWGTEYGDEKRNGEWEYAWFNADGSRKAEVTMDSCFTCHKEQAAANDYMFTFPAFLAFIEK